MHKRALGHQLQTASAEIASRLLGLRCQVSKLRTVARQPKAYDGLWSNSTFEELGIHQQLIQALAAQDIVRPTLVQAEALKPLAKGRDAILCAETGSGKTLAYLLPLLNRIYHLHDRAREAARTDSNAANPLQSLRPWVVLAPTSDLCAQILAMLEGIDGDRLVAAQSLQRLFKWEARAGKEVTAFQEPKMKERTSLELQGSSTFAAPPQPGSMSGSTYAAASPRIRWGAVDLVVSTPIKFCEDLEQFKDDGIFPACIVMDEADALFHGPSRTYLYDIFAAMRPRLKIRQPDERRQGMPDLVPSQFVFSAATMVHIGPWSVGNMLIERFCTAQVVQTPRFHSLPTGIRSDNVRWIEGSDDWERRIDQLVGIFREIPCERTVVFVNTIHNCHVLLKFLKEKGWPVVSFMKGPVGRMGPRFRDAQQFADGKSSILISTDFGGRGIDWPEVDHVVNFQMPSNAIFWLHRVGRTGRMGRHGLVTNLVGSKDQVLSEMIKMRLDSGKDLHSVFSRKRSLRRYVRRDKQTEEDEAEPEQLYRLEDGTYRLQGGLELYEEGLARGASGAASSSQAARTERGADHADHGDSADNSAVEGTLIGYLSMPEEPGDVGRRLRQRAREGSRGGNIRTDASVAVRPGVGESGSFAVEDDALQDFRRQLLESDSEGDSEQSGEGSSGEDDADDQVEAGSQRSLQSPPPARPSAGGDFSWAMLGNTGEGAVVASPPRRQVLNRSKQKEDRGNRRFSRADQSQQYTGGRKGQGVAAQSKVRAGRNYSEPDDDLLPL